MTVKPWELPKWAREQAARLGLALDAAAAKALVAQVGERQQRLLRELEKLALEGGSAAASGGTAPRKVAVEEIESRAARSAERRAYALADALVAADARRGDGHLPAAARAGRASRRADLPDRLAAARRARGRREQLAAGALGGRDQARPADARRAPPSGLIADVGAQRARAAARGARRARRPGARLARRRGARRRPGHAGGDGRGHARRSGRSRRSARPVRRREARRLARIAVARMRRAIGGVRRQVAACARVRRAGMASVR